MLPFSCIIKVYNAITTIFQSLVYQDHYAEKAERRMKTNIISSEELRQIGVSFDVKDNRLKDIGDYYIIDRTVEVGEETDRKEFRYGTIHLFLTDEKSSLRDPKRIAYSQSTDFYIMEDNTSEIYDDRSILILECRKEACKQINELFGLDIDVELNSAWLKIAKEVVNEVKQEEAEVKKTEAEAKATEEASDAVDEEIKDEEGDTSGTEEDKSNS